MKLIVVIENANIKFASALNANELMVNDGVSIVPLVLSPLGTNSTDVLSEILNAYRISLYHGDPVALEEVVDTILLGNPE